MNYFLGSAYLDAGRFQEALPQLKELLRIEPRRAEIYLALVASIKD